MMAHNSLNRKDDSIFGEAINSDRWAKRKIFIAELPAYSMAQSNIQMQLTNLQDTLEELKGLLAWEELKRSEARPGEPPRFTIGDDMEQDIKNQYSRFLMTRLQLRSLLDNPDTSSLPESRMATLRQRLISMEKEFQVLNLRERFIKF